MKSILVLAALPYIYYTVSSIYAPFSVTAYTLVLQKWDDVTTVFMVQIKLCLHLYCTGIIEMRHLDTKTLLFLDQKMCAEEYACFTEMRHWDIKTPHFIPKSFCRKFPTFQVLVNIKGKNEMFVSLTAFTVFLIAVSWRSQFYFNNR